MMLLMAVLVAWWGGTFLFMWGLCAAASGRPLRRAAMPMAVRASDDPPFLPS